MAHIKELWLDLEDTVITPVVNGWFNIQLINIEKVKKVIADFKPDKVHVFSFAIHDKAQRERFNMSARERVERAFGVTFDLVLTCDDDITPICSRQMGLHPSTVDFRDMVNFWSKHGAWRLCMRSHASTLAKRGDSLEALLLDDMVYDETITWPDVQATIKCLNVDTLPT